MPHSTVTEPVVPSSPAEEDSVLPDAPPQALDYVKAEIEDENKTERGDSMSKAPYADVKLEDLFNDGDDEDNDEFLSSAAVTAKPESSPPAAPL